MDVVERGTGGRAMWQWLPAFLVPIQDSGTLVLPSSDSSFWDATHPDHLSATRLSILGRPLKPRAPGTHGKLQYQHGLVHWDRGWMQKEVELTPPGHIVLHLFAVLKTGPGKVVGEGEGSNISGIPGPWRNASTLV